MEIRLDFYAPGLVRKMCVLILMLLLKYSSLIIFKKFNKEVAVNNQINCALFFEAAKQWFTG